MNLLLVGSTGLVGSHVLKQALSDQRVSKVIALTRRALPEHPKLQSLCVDFDNLAEDASYWQADAVICTLGTTMRIAGSEHAFRQVDYDYPLTVARLVRQHGTLNYVLNSAIGADASSRFFYNRVKGELERDLTELNFPSLAFVRPGLIAGNRIEFRLTERILVTILSLLNPLLPKRWRLNPAEKIANALLECAVDPKAGVQVITSEQLI